MTRVAVALLTLAVLVFPAFADGAKPAVLAMTEVAPGQFEVEFRVPRAGSRVPVLRPVLPDAFRTVRKPESVPRPGELVTTWRVSAAPWEVAGKPIRIDGLAAAINDTIVRVRFLDGTTISRIIMPEMPVTSFPDRAARPGATTAETVGFSTAVLAGARNVVFGPGHLVFLLGIAIAGSLRPVLRALAGFAIAHLAGVLLAAATGVGIPAPPAEALLAVAGAVAVASRRAPIGVAILAGLGHGASLPGGLVPGIGMTLGIDAVQILGGAAAVFVVRGVARVRLRAVLTYATGVAGICFALAAVTEAAPESPREPGAPLLLSLVPPTSGGAPSVAVAPGPAEDAPVRVFLAVEPTEVRVEAVLRIASLLPARETIPVEAQAAVKQEFGMRVAERVRVHIDGKPVRSGLTRIDFVERTPTGVLERPEPVPEPFADARIGVVLVFPVRAIPEVVAVDWGIATPDAPVAVTISDPERIWSAEGSGFTWRNELRAPPAPTAEMVERRRPALRLSILSALLVLGSLGLMVLRRGRHVLGLTAARLGLAVAGLAAPILPVAVPLPAGATPSDTEAKAIAEALLTNVHRAFDYHDESDVYERLAVSVTGEELNEIYLEHRKNLLLAMQGGARARADAVEVTDVRDLESRKGGGFTAEVEWRVSGFVFHFGHRHFRWNVHRADLTVVPDGDAWKLREIDIREKVRVR